MSTPPSAWRAVAQAMLSWRTASVSLLSFSSGLPLGLVWIAIPTWLAREGVDIRLIGLFTLAQVPWSFKFLWSPLMDRYTLPLPRVGRKLGWTLLWQVGLFVATLALGGIDFSHQALWLIGTLTLAIAFASASQDIVIDAYAVEVLEPHEQGVAVGARTAVYRAAMFISGGLAITLAGWWTWSVVFMALAALYLPMMVVAWRAPRPAAERELAPASLREAVWEPFVNFLARRRAVELILFVLLYKLADNLAGALVRPFLVQVGFNDFDVGVATATIGLAATLLGTFLGGLLTTAMGLGHALWVFGLLQIVSNYGYVLIADAGPNRWLMYGAMGFESLTSGMGTGAFGVLLLRMTHVRFSTTQYALFTSIFALPRILAGPATGVMVDAAGWHDFFLFTLGVGIPGLLLLHRFAPLGVREPEIHELALARPQPIRRGELLGRATIGALAGLLIGAGTVALLEAVKLMRAGQTAGFDLPAALASLLRPETVGGWVTLAGVAVFTLLVALGVAATAVARHGRG